MSELQQKADVVEVAVGPRRGRRILRRGLAALAVLLVLYGLAIAIVRNRFHGSRLAQFVMETVNPGIRGRLTIDRIDWPLWNLLTLQLGRIPVVVHGIHVFDPEGRPTLEIPRAHATIDAWALIRPTGDLGPYEGGHRDLLIDDLVVAGGRVIVEAHPTPGGPDETEVGFTAAFAARDDEDDDEPRRPGSIIHLRTLELRAVRLELRFPAWAATIDSLSTHGWLRKSSRVRPASPDATGFIPDFTYFVAPSTGHATLHLAGGGGVDFEFTQLDVATLAQLPDARDKFVWRGKARTVEGATLEIDGFLSGLYDEVGGVALAIDFAHAGALAARVSKGVVSGDDLSGRFALAGPSGAARLDLVAERAAVRTELPGAGPIAATVRRVVVSLTGDTNIAELSELDADLFGGRLQATARVQLPDANLPLARCGLDAARGGELPCGVASVEILEPVELAGLLPDKVVELAGGTRLSGKIAILGQRSDLLADTLDLHLGGAHALGKLRFSAGTLRTDRLVLDVPHGTIEASGSIDTRRRQLAIAFRAQARRLRPLLKQFRVPPLATSATARGTVNGSLDRPVTSARVSVRGVPWVDAVTASLRHVGDRLAIQALDAHPFGGELHAEGDLTLGRLVTITRLALRASNLELAQVPGLEQLVGLVDLHAEADGPLTQPRVQLSARATGTAALGVPLGDLRLDAAWGDDGLVLHRVTLGGADAKAELRLSGTIGRRRELDLALVVERAELAALPGVTPALAVDGEASLHLDANGTLDAPLLSGRLGLHRVAAGIHYYGDGRLAIGPRTGDVARPGLLQLGGSLFQGKLALDLSWSLFAPHDLTLTVRFRRVELDDLTDALAASFGVRGFATGEATVRLRPGERDPARRLTGALRLEELHVEVDGQDPRGHPRVVALELCGAADGRAAPVLIDWDGATVRLPAPARICTPAGELVLAGRIGLGLLGVDAIDARLRGELSLGVAELFLGKWVDNLSGSAAVDLRVTGSLSAPRLLGTVRIDKASARPRGSEHTVSVPKGVLTLANDEIALERLELEVDGAKLQADGHLTLVNLAPTTLDARVRGRLAARLLAIIAGAAFSDAGGAAAVELTLRGPFAAPEIQGALRFDSPFSLTPRGLRREITIREGRLAFREQTLVLEQLRGEFNEARLLLAGFVDLRGWRWSGVDARIELEGFALRIPEQLQLEANAALRLSGGPDGLALDGEIALVDGAYVGRFSYVNLLVPVRTTERNAPFWEGNPLLEHLRLALSVQTVGTLRVNTNIASGIHITSPLGVRISGTLARPRLDGAVEAHEGTIKLPGVRPTFTVDRGAVRFFGGDDPAPLSLRTLVTLNAETLYTDTEGRTHEIDLEIKGPLAALEVSMSTRNTGLNAAQTLLLVTAGRTTDQLRQQARGDDPGAPRVGDTGGVGGSSGVASATDQLVKDFASDFISALVEAPLKDLTGLDCVRLEIGTESALVYGCKKIGRAVQGEGEYEQGFRGGNRKRLGLGWKLTDNFTLTSDYQSLRPEAETLETETRFRSEFKFRFVIP